MAPLMKAGVVLDSYKAPIFRQHLKDAGFTWEEMPGPGKTTQTWVIDYFPDQLEKLKETLQTATNISQRRN